MFIKILLLIFAVVFSAGAQTENKSKLGILNGRAIHLPKPVYSQEAKDFCASGKTETKVVIDEDGNVITAEAISGDELLRDASVEAAKQAKFTVHGHLRAKTEGIIVYNFVPERKCIDAGIVNKKAKYLAKPFLYRTVPGNFEISVRVMIDLTTGKVTAAKAINGHPLLRDTAEKAALETTFAPALINGPPVPVKGVIVYKFKNDGIIQLNNEEKTQNSETPKGKPIVDLAGGTLIGKAIKLRKPKFPFCNCKFGKNPKTIVQFTVDESGIVETASGISGHPLLKIEGEKAIRQSKFSISRVDGLPVKAFGIIVYAYFKSKNGMKSHVVKYELKLEK